ncbi:hypothetical protein APS67_002612 [Streptomyces sp. AVP053U2]|nr:hypothetical protein APS67_002612 [Streptomyces sp. AVP053U2]
MVVDGGVQVAVTGVLAVLAACLPAQDLVSAAVGDVAQLLDVDVHQLAGPLAFVAADDAAGGAVQVGEAGQAEAGQYPVHGRGHQVQQVGDAGGAPAAQDADLDDPAFGAGRGAARAGARTGGAVGHARLADGPVALGPALGGGRRDLEAFRGASKGPAVLDHAAGQAQPSGLGQGCITVGHEGLSVAGADVAIHTRPEGPHPFQDQSAVSPGGGRRDLEAFRGASKGPAVLDHAAGQAQPSGLGQGCITVGHEGLSVAGADVAIHTRPEGPHPFQDQSAVSPVTVHNLPGQNI